MTKTNTNAYCDVDVVKAERELLSLTLAYQKAKTNKNRRVVGQLTSMIAGKAWKIITRTYRVETNRETVWREWRKLAGASLLD